MTSDQLRAYLDAHGVDGAPTVPGWYVVETFDIVATPLPIFVIHAAPGDVRVSLRIGGDESVTLLRSDCIRHAPLPDFAAMARELEELRARRPVACGDCGGSGSHGGTILPVAMCETCGGSGAVWVTP